MVSTPARSAPSADVDSGSSTDLEPPPIGWRRPSPHGLAAAAGLALTSTAFAQSGVAVPDSSELAEISGLSGRSALAIAAGCLALASIGAHAAAVLQVYSPTKLTKLAQKRSPEHADTLVAELDARDEELQITGLVVALGGIAACVSLAGQAATDAFGFGIAAAGTFAILLLCAALPIALASRRAEELVLRLLPLMRPLHWLLRYPLVLPLFAVARGLLRILRLSTDEPAKPGEVAESILAAVHDSAADAELPSEERSWIGNIVALKDLQVCEVMTPRTDVVAFDADLPLLEAAQLADKSGFSRYPVYEQTIDNVTGVFYAKDALKRLSNGDSKEVAVRELARPPLFVPEGMGAIDLLQRLKADKVQMAVVLDEYGGTAGLVSLEDVVEEIVGEIVDEHDVREEMSIEIIEADRVVEITGRVRVDEINEALGSEIPEDDDYDTVAGFVFTTLGKIPQLGEKLHTHGVEIEILAADERRISRMRVTTLEPQSSSPAAD